MSTYVLEWEGKKERGIDVEVEVEGKKERGIDVEVEVEQAR